VEFQLSREVLDGVLQPRAEIHYHYSKSRPEWTENEGSHDKREHRGLSLWLILDLSWAAKAEGMPGVEIMKQSQA
jgi:hypothetical protein